MHRIISVICGFLVVVMLGSSPVSAAGTNSSTFAVSPLFSEHQSKTVNAFFDIKWVPGQTDKIGIAIRNKQDKEMTYQLAVNKAKTNANTVIDYSNTKKEDKKAAKPSVTTLVHFPNEVTVKAHSIKKVYTNITFPKKDFNGIKMAGIRIQEKQAADVKKAEVKNSVSYVLPLVLRGNKQQRPAPKITFGKAKLEKAAISGYELVIPVTNKKENLLKNTKLHMQLMDKKGHVMGKTKATAIITPETMFRYPLHMPQKYSSGTYTAVMTVKHKEQVWKTTQKVTITKAQSQKAKEALPKKSWKDYLGNPLILMLLTILGTLIVVVVLVKLRKILQKNKA